MPRTRVPVWSHAVVPMSYLSHAFGVRLAMSSKWPVDFWELDCGYEISNPIVQ